jgi:hypothetical protein
MSEIRKLATWEVAAGREIRLDRVEPITTASSPPLEHDCDYYRRPDGVGAYCDEVRPTEPSRPSASPVPLPCNELVERAEQHDLLAKQLYVIFSEPTVRRSRAGQRPEHHAVDEGQAQRSWTAEMTAHTPVARRRLTSSELRTRRSLFDTTTDLLRVLGGGGCGSGRLRSVATRGRDRRHRQ